MDYKVNYAIVGAFVVILGIASVVITLWLSAADARKSYKNYIVYLDESVSGLSESTPVKFNGVDVGLVKTIRLNPKDYKQVVVLVGIEKKIPITEMTFATLRAQGITGLAYLELEVKDSGAPLVKRQKGQPYPVIKSSPSFLVRLDTMLKKTSESIKDLASSMQKVFDEENRQAFKKSLSNFEKITQAFAENSQKISHSIQLLEKILANLSDASEDFQSTLLSIKSSSVGIGQAGKEANIAIQNFSQQVLPSTSEVMRHLNNAAVNLETFSEDLSRNPASIIWGKASTPLGPGER